MIAYIVRRLAAVVLILLGVSAITYCLLFLLPADPVDLLAGRNATPEMREALRRELGLDQPMPVQYAVYLGKLVQGDMGRSLAQKVDVSLLIAARLPATLQLMAAAIAASLLLGLPAGMYAAMRRGTVPDKAAMIASFAGVSAPQFVVGLLLLYLFAYKLGWLPMGGYGLAHLILPALTVGSGQWRLVFADDALVDDRGAVPGLYADGAGQGPAPLARRSESRLPQRHAADHRHGGHRHGLSDHQTSWSSRRCSAGRASASYCGRPSSGSTTPSSSASPSPRRL